MEQILVLSEELKVSPIALGWVLFGIGALMFVTAIIVMVTADSDGAAVFMAAGIICIVIGLVMALDNRTYTEVKAYIPPNTEWHEINDKYTVHGYEGDIVILRVREQKGEK